jgi:hypothetical protein
MGLFGMKIDWDVDKAFLTEAVSTVSPLGLLYSGSDRNHDISGHFDIFSSLTAIMIKFV